MRNRYIKTILISFFLFFCLFLGRYNSSYAIYRDILNTKVYLSVLDNSQTFTITFDPVDGNITEGNAQKVLSANSELGSLPIAEKAGYNFIGWYTADGNTKVDIHTLVVGNVSYYAHYVKQVCKKAAENTLHTETCYKSSNPDAATPGCRSAGYAQNGTITYGTLPGNDSPLPGDAYDCDVNNDDIFDPATERFYFLRENDQSQNGGSDIGVLVHYTSFDENGQTDSNINRKIYSFDAGKTWLPGNSLWTNPALTVIDGKVSRYPNQDDVVAACGEWTTNNGYLDSCKFFLENSRFQSDELGRSAIWLDKINNENYRIDTRTRKVTPIQSDATSSVRPVIEIPFNTIDGYKERISYTITFDSRGGSTVDPITRYANQKIGNLPSPTKENHIFDGWYTDTNFTDQVDENTIVTGNAKYYAKWTEIVEDMPMVFYIPGSCTFHGATTEQATTNITSDSPSGCISTINHTDQNIDYTNQKYIDSHVSLFSSDNFAKDFELGFNIDDYVVNNTVPTQATMVNSKLENSTQNYPGFVIRRNGAKTEITEKFGSSTAYGGIFTYTQGMKMTVARMEGIMYYKIDDGDWIQIQDINSYTGRFNLTTWFGAISLESSMEGTGENSSADRFFNGTLSNIYIKLESDNSVKKTVTFNAGDGVAEFDEKKVTRGNSIGSLPSASNPGYYFDGWYTEAQGGRKITENEIINDDVEFYAHYKNIYLVTFNPGEGTTSLDQNTVEVVDGETLQSTLPSMPIASLDGYVFDGWYTQNDELIDGTEPITNDVTYNAHYLIAHTVTFDAGEGGEPSFNEKKVGHGKPVGNLPNATRENYEFEGWYTDNTYSTPVDEEDTIINNDETFVAKWRFTDMVARVGSTSYETLQAAINSVPTNGTKTVLTLLKDVTLTEYVNVTASRNIEFDLQNYTISGSQSALIVNYGTIEIKNGTLNNTGAEPHYSINNKYGGTVNITGGLIASTKTNAIINSGTINITGGKVTCAASAAAINNNENGILNISSGQIITSNTQKSQAVYNNLGTTNISGDAYLESKSNNRATVHNYQGTVNITGGEIVAKGSFSAVLNADIMTIGDNSDPLDITSPVITGATYGLEINSGKTVTVYDGIFKGKTAGINDTSRTTHDNNLEFDTTGTETISGATYHTAVLKQTSNQHTVHFDEQSGDDVDDITVDDDKAIGQLPTTSKTGTRFIGWFTEAQGGEQIYSSTKVTEDVTYYAHFTNSETVCVPATMLHSYNSTTYGTLQSGPTLSPGNAYDCDVNGDGTYDSNTERFYYLRDDEVGNAVFIYSNNVSNVGTSGPTCNANDVSYGVSPYKSGPETAYAELQSTSSWSNVGLYTTPRQIINENGTTDVGSNTAETFAYPGKSSRLPTVKDIKEATVSSLNGAINELANPNYSFLFENLVSNSSGNCNTSYWLETPLEAGNNIFIIDGTDNRLYNSSLSSSVRPVIEVPYDSIETEKDLVTFDTIPTAMRTYFNNIDSWSSNQTDDNHSSYDTQMTNNLDANNCVYFQNDNRDTEYQTQYCDQPNKYDTGVIGPVNVYKYNLDTKTVDSNIASYITSDQGKIYNMIPGEVYYWEDASDPTTNGYVKAVGERRIISVDNVLMQDNTATSSTLHKMRNVRDLGGISVSYKDSNNKTVNGKIKYGKLFRGEKIWTGSGQYLNKLGITHEMDLRAQSEKNGAASSEDNLSNKIVGPSQTDTYEIIHYGIDYDGYTDKDGNPRNDYALARGALKAVMTEFVNAHNSGNDDYSLLFHCRIGADRTGTLAYLLEGILGVSEEDRYKDFEMTVFFGLRERTRFYYEKTSTHDKIKFVHLKQAIRDAGDGTSEDVVAWFLKGSADNAERTSDMELIQNFRSILVE